MRKTPIRLLPVVAAGNLTERVADNKSGNHLAHLVLNKTQAGIIWRAVIEMFTRSM